MFIGEYLLPGVKQLDCHSRKQAKPFYRRVFMDADRSSRQTGDRYSLSV
jgi:hypothetical protein